MQAWKVRSLAVPRQGWRISLDRPNPYVRASLPSMRPEPLPEFVLMRLRSFVLPCQARRPHTFARHLHLTRAREIRLAVPVIGRPRSTLPAPSRGTLDYRRSTSPAPDPSSPARPHRAQFCRSLQPVSRSRHTFRDRSAPCPTSPRHLWLIGRRETHPFDKRARSRADQQPGYRALISSRRQDIRFPLYQSRVRLVSPPSRKLPSSRPARRADPLPNAERSFSSSARIALVDRPQLQGRAATHLLRDSFPLPRPGSQRRLAVPL